MSTSLGYQINRNPLAQSFYIEEPSGIFLTKIDLFFKTRDTAAPVCLQIRPMHNGMPSTSEIVPQSVVYINGNNVNTSDDATAATSFEFEEPVYLRGLQDYSFVVITNSIDYKIFISQIDEFEVGTTASRIARNPALGSLFYSANGGTFTAAQDQDMAFKLYRAEFSSASGLISLKNASLPMKLLNVDPITTVGTSSTVKIADLGHGFVVNDEVTIRGLDSSLSIGGIQTTSIMGIAKTITAVDWSGYEITADSAADSDAIGGGIGVKVTKNIPWSAYYSNAQLLVPEQTTVNGSIKATRGKSFAGSEVPYSKENNYIQAQVADTVFTRKPYVVANNDIETTELGAGVKSLETQFEFISNSNVVAPMLDMQRTSMTLIDAIIDKQDSAATNGFNVPMNYVDETSAAGGSAASKHITRIVTLIEPAVGLKIIIAANRPNGADFQMYYRAAEDGIDITTQDYTLLPTLSNNPFDDNPFTFREYQYLAGGDGGQLPEFTKFQLKIVMRAVDRSKPPIFKDLRVIALSV
jgi:hypothetical protein